MRCAARRWVLAALVAAGLVPLGCRATGGPLPSGAALGSYEDAGDTESYTPLTLYSYMDGGADVFVEYGLVSAWVKRYRSGVNELTVELYKMRDRDAAAALFSYMRRAGAEQEIAPGCRGGLTGSEARLAKGGHVLVCRNEDPMAEQPGVVRDLCARLAGGIEGDCGVGSLFDALPAKGRVPGTEVALVGPLGFNLRPWLVAMGRDGFERGWMAAYALESGPAEALVAQYATPEEASDAVIGFAKRQPPSETTVVVGRRVVVVHAEGESEMARNDLARRLSNP